MWSVSILKMAVVLFVAHPNVGHLNPLLSIASRLRKEGCRCIFAAFGGPWAERYVTQAGFEARKVRSPLSALGLTLLPRVRGALETLLAATVFTAQPAAYAAQMVKLIEEVQPSVVVADFAFLGAGIAADRAGIPWVSVYHAGLLHAGPGVPPAGSGLSIGSPLPWRARVIARIQDLLRGYVYASLQRARRRFGLSDAGPVDALWSSPWLTLILTAAEVEAPRNPMPPGTFFVGPCLGERPKTPEAFPFHLLANGRPRVYVSMGTVFNRRPTVFRQIVRGLSRDFQVVVSAGACGKNLSDLQDPPNVLIFKQVPQLELLPLVDVVVSHGGNNTVTEALAAGRPLLVMPQGGEQDSNASRVTWLGAGLRANGHHVSPAEVRKGVMRLATDPSFRQAAERVADVLRGTDGVGTSARFIQRLMGIREPLRQPPGYPSTVTASTAMPWDFTLSPSPDPRSPTP